MKKLSVIILLLQMMVVNGFTKPITKKFNAANLQISWQVVENNYNGKLQFKSALDIKNTDKNPLPATGWKLYFNCGRQIIPSTVTGNVTIEHLNGDFFCLSPTANFVEIKSGQSLNIEFVSDFWALNFTDAPQGFYFVSNKNSDVYTAIKNMTQLPNPSQFNRTPDDKVPFITPEAVFMQNKMLADIPERELPPIFPTPVSCQQTGQEFLLNASVKVIADPAFVKESAYLKQELTRIFERSAKKWNQNPGNSIFLKVKEGMAPEAYNLEVGNKSIIISASKAAGVFYGIQSLKSMFPGKAWSGKMKCLEIPGVQVSDAPRFGYRGLMLDVARNFQTQKEVLKVLDLMSLYKLNVLHFHLNDDEGWRLEIPSLPELTSVGARRGHTLDNKLNLPPSYGSGPNVNNPYGSGFYTKADFIAILKYANDRHITVIPEIETPGHARAAIKAMDARYDRLISLGKKEAAERFLLHDLNDQSIYKSVQYWNDNVIDVSLPSTYNFIETVTDEVIKMYKEADAPIKTIHFGGDEVPAGAWVNSPSCQQLINADPEIKNTDGLWYYYWGKVNQILKQHNLYVSGWEEMGLRKTEINGKKTTIPNSDFLKADFHLYVWNNVLGWGAEDLAYKLANSGYPVVLSCVSNFYFDLAHQKAFDEPGYYWGGFLDVDKPFKFIPYNYFKNTNETLTGKRIDPSFFATKEALNAQGRVNIAGIQGLLWSETIKGPSRMEYMLLPKLFGLAERAWAQNPDWATETDSLKSGELYQKAWTEFTNIAGKKELPRLDYYAGGFKYRIPTAGVLVKDKRVEANVQFPGMTIHYTTDGSDPVVSSPVYRQPLYKKGLLKFRVFNTVGTGGRIVSISVM